MLSGGSCGGAGGAVAPGSPTLSEVITANNYSIVTLPHARRKEGSVAAHKATADLVDPCLLPVRTQPREKLGWLPQFAGGLHEAERLTLDGLHRMVRAILADRPLFTEVLLARPRRC